MDVSKYSKLNEKQKSAETDPFTEKRYEQFARHMPESANRILDIGCSTGRGGGALKRLLPDIDLHGLDCSKTRLAKLPAIYTGRHFGNVTKLPFPNERFDVVLMGEFIEHIQPKDVDSVLSECQRVLRVGGEVYVNDAESQLLAESIFRENCLYNQSLEPTLSAGLKT